MSQRYDQDLILAYVEDELDNGARYRFERQLQQDHRLQTLVQQLVDDRRQLRNVPPEAPPEGLMDRAQGFLERQMLLGDAASQAGEQAAHARHRLVRWTAWSGVAALFLIGVGTLLFIFAETRSFQKVITRVTPTEEHVPAPAAPQPLETAKATAGDTATSADASWSAAATDTLGEGAAPLAAAPPSAEMAPPAPEGVMARMPSNQQASERSVVPATQPLALPAALAATPAKQPTQPAQTAEDWPRQLWRCPLSPVTVPLAPTEPVVVPLRPAP